jgi:hypothetical protein
MASEEEITEVDMVGAGVPPERAAAEVWIVSSLGNATRHCTVLNDVAEDGTDLERLRARANLIAALLAAADAGLTAAELQGEVSAAFGEVFERDGSTRTLARTYGWRRPGDDS